MPRKEPRNYKSEYSDYHAKEGSKKDRALRNNARRDAIKTGKAHKGDGTAVDHIIPLSKGGSNAKSNRRVVSAQTNRKKTNKV